MNQLSTEYSIFWLISSQVLKFQKIIIVSFISSFLQFHTNKQIDKYEKHLVFRCDDSDSNDCYMDKIILMTAPKSNFKKIIICLSEPAKSLVEIFVPNFFKNTQYGF